MFSGPITVFSSNYSGGPLSNSYNDCRAKCGINNNNNGCAAGSTGSSYMYNVLSNYIKSIQTLTDEYAQGEFLLVSQILTQDMYDKLATDLNNFAKDPATFPEYEILRKTICSALSGLYQSIIQHALLLDTESKLAACQEMENILKDPVLLQQYINEQKHHRSLFPESNVALTTQAQLKPQYAEYVSLYGFPTGGVFEMDKLAEIIKRLNME